MVAQIGLKLSASTELYETSISPGVKRRRMSRPRKRLSCGQGRDFFRLAASFASVDQRESDFSEAAGRDSQDLLIDNMQSRFLQARYQERSTPFVAFAHHVQPYDASHVCMSVIEKWRKATGQSDPNIEALILNHNVMERPGAQLHYKTDTIKNGVRFSHRELNVLEVLAEQQIAKSFLATPNVSCRAAFTAPEFHQAIKAIMDNPRHKPFFAIVNGDEKILVQWARLFWSHRLRVKSLQETNSAESSICYYHAALRAESDVGFDVLYRLNLNHEKVVTGGEFINLGKKHTTPHELFLAEDVLFKPERRATCIAALDGPIKLFVEEVVSLIKF